MIYFRKIFVRIIKDLNAIRMECYFFNDNAVSGTKTKIVANRL